jgi:hypothetical protein
LSRRVERGGKALEEISDDQKCKEDGRSDQGRQGGAESLQGLFTRMFARRLADGTVRPPPIGARQRAPKPVSMTTTVAKTMPVSMRADRLRT